MALLSAPTGYRYRHRYMYFLFCVLSCVGLLLLGGTITEIKQPYSFAEPFLQCYPRHFILAVLYLYFYVIVLIILILTTIITITNGGSDSPIANRNHHPPPKINWECSDPLLPPFLVKGADGVLLRALPQKSWPGCGHAVFTCP